MGFIYWDPSTVIAEVTVAKGFLWFMILTHCGLETPYGDMEMGQHWLR